MSIYRSCRKVCPDFVVNDYITDKIKTLSIRTGYRTVRIDEKNTRLTDKSLTFCCLTPLSFVCRKGCLVDIIEIFIKSAPKNKKLKKLIPVNKLFTREVFFLNTILKEFNQFQGAPNLLDFILEESNEALIIQNAEGWVPRYEKFQDELTDAHIEVVLKELSKLHALSLAFEIFKPEQMHCFRKTLEDGTYLSTLENKETVRIIQENLKQILTCLDDQIAIQRLKKFCKELPQELDNILSDFPEKSVLLHGDPTNCFLFSYEKPEAGNVPARAKLLDWQLVKFGSPVLDISEDISLFLFTNLSDLKNLNHFLESYHINLSQHLQKFRCDVDDFFDFNLLKEHWKKYAKFGLALAFLTLKIILLEPNERPDANNEDLSEDEFIQNFIKSPNKDFIKRMKALVGYCIEDELI